jgi:hypothetical protein
LLYPRASIESDIVVVYGTLVIFQPWNVYFPADGKVAFLGWNTYLSQ